MNKIIINVGRQIGSGGHIIAEKLAEDFGCKCYDRELLNLAAKESGFSEKFFEQNDEQKGFFKSLFHTHNLKRPRFTVRFCTTGNESFSLWQTGLLST